MTNKPNNKIEEKRYYACRVCGFSPTNRSTWCDKGCGSDYNEMIELKGLKEALTSHGEEMKKEGYEQGVRDERERIWKELAEITRVRSDGENYILTKLPEYKKILQSLKNN